MNNKIENNAEIMALVNSQEWASDTLGLLQREFFDLCNKHGISEAEASDWLHGDDL